MDTKEFKQEGYHLSPCKDSDDWSIHEWAFKKIDRHWGPHTVDRFSSHYSSKCKRYNSRWWVPGTEAVDSFGQDWGSPEVIWLVPPPRLIKVI